MAGCYLFCPAEGRRFAKKGEVVPLLPEARGRELEPFLGTYRVVRRAEGWRGDARYYLDLPFRDRSGRHTDIWKIRARSFRAGLREIRRACGAGPLRVLELGAGNCWLSSRLARFGHRVLATDVSLDGEDGLAAFDIYRSYLGVNVDRAQVDMEDLPLTESQFDVVVVNGAIHYARHPSLPITEARRVLRDRGLFLVLDSPAYRERKAGNAMVNQRMEEHRRKYGLSFKPALQSGFLLMPDFVERLEDAGFTVRVIQPFEGLKRFARRRLSRPMRWRLPAEFPVFAARKREGC